MTDPTLVSVPAHDTDVDRTLHSAAHGLNLTAIEHWTQIAVTIIQSIIQALLMARKLTT
jgi:hypothetical protein